MTTWTCHIAYLSHLANLSRYPAAELRGHYIAYLRHNIANLSRYPAAELRGHDIAYLSHHIAYLSRHPAAELRGLDGEQHQHGADELPEAPELLGPPELHLHVPPVHGLVRRQDRQLRQGPALPGLKR